MKQPGTTTTLDTLGDRLMYRLAYRNRAGVESLLVTHGVDPDGAGPAQAFTFGRPDFNFKSLRVNAVARWEFRPGSSLYLVWTQRRQDQRAHQTHHPHLPMKRPQPQPVPCQNSLRRL